MLADSVPAGGQRFVGFDGSFDIAGKPRQTMIRQGAQHQALGRRRSSRPAGRLYANDRYSVLLIFQAMDAAGKDGTIRAILTGVSPVGCQVFAYKAPSSEELDHDFLWRCIATSDAAGSACGTSTTRRCWSCVHPNISPREAPKKPARSAGVARALLVDRGCRASLGAQRLRRGILPQRLAEGQRRLDRVPIG
jgi:hypothetical protein